MATSATRRFAGFIKARGWTQEEAARAMGLSQSMISSVLSGRRRPSIDVATVIEERTGGEIRVGDWARPRRRKAVRKAA